MSTFFIMMVWFGGLRTEVSCYNFSNWIDAVFAADWVGV